MKKNGLIKVSLVLLLLLNVLWVRCQTRTSDYVYAGLSGGYGMLLGMVDPMSVPGLASGGVSVGYEMRHRNLLLRIGAEGLYVGSRSNTEISVGDVRIEDARMDGSYAWMHYKMVSPLQESQNIFGIGFGVSVGYSANDYQDSRIHGGFYVLGGVKVLFRCAESNSVSLRYRTTATYDKYIDDYEDMWNHGYTEFEVSAKPEFDFWGFLAVSAELGWEFNINGYDKLKTGAFCDCGFTNVMAGQKISDVHVNDRNATLLVIDSYYRSSAMADTYVVPLTAGVRLSYSWNMNKLRNCHGRNCLPYRTKRRR